MHPLSRRQKWYRRLISFILSGIILLVVFTGFALLVQLSLYNPVIIYLLYKVYKELYTFLQGYKKKIDRDYRTKNFRDYIEQ